MPKDIGRKTEARKETHKENYITEGRIETAVHAFHLPDPLSDPPFSAIYGEHKIMGSEMAPIQKGGRGAKASFRSKLNTGGN